MPTRAEILRTELELDAIAPRWAKLAELAGNPFVSPQWFVALLPEIESRWQPAVVAVRRDDVLVGVLPFVQARGRRHAELRLAGADRADVLSPATHPDDALEVAEAAAVVIEELSPRGAVRLGRVDANAGWWRALGTGGRRRRAPVVGPPEALPFARLPGEWDEYLAARSRSFRSQLGRKMRALQRDHEVTIRRSVATGDIERDLESLFQLHDRRWEGREGTSAFGPETRAFHRRLGVVMAEAGWARVMVMDVDEEPVAAWYGWRLGERMLYYQAGFDPAWQQRSVGFLLLGETVRAAIEEGCHEYDMLLGDESFKARFAEAARTGREVTLARSMSATRARLGIHNVVRHAWRRLPANAQARIRSFRR